MSCASKCIFKPSSMANGCLTSVSLNFTSNTVSPYLSVPTRPLKLHLCCSFSSLLPPLFTFKKGIHFTRAASFVASREGEDDTTVPEKEKISWSEQENDGIQSGMSNWEADFEGEPEEGGGIEAIGDGGESGEEDGFLEDGGEDYPEPPEEAKLFVGNLPYNVDSEKLAHLFEQAGVVAISEVKYDRETGRSRGFGFVTMSTVEAAEKAVEMFNRCDLNGRLLNVNKAAPKRSQPERPVQVFEPGLRIYVGNLPWDVDNARLEQVFSEHGKVTSALVKEDRESGRSRGFGFVMMSSKAEMNDAIANLDGQSLDGRILKVSAAMDRSRSSRF